MLIDGKRFFDILIKNNEETYKQIIEMGRNNDTQQVSYWIVSTFQNTTN